MEHDESSRDSSPEADNKRDPKGGSFSSLMNILNTMKKSTMQKNALESRKRLDDIAKQGVNFIQHSLNSFCASRFTLILLVHSVEQEGATYGPQRPVFKL